jgi:hypothetical protein
MDPRQLIEQLRKAVDAHDLDAVAACFAADYRNETPAHPNRGFEGIEQVRANWARIFGGVPDIRARVLRTCTDGDDIWTEWEMGGTRPDGVPQLLRGVIVFSVVSGLLARARFYLEPVDPGEGGVEAAITELVEGER